MKGYRVRWKEKMRGRPRQTIHSTRSKGRKVVEGREGDLNPVRIGRVSSRARFDKEGLSVEVLDGAGS